MCPERLDPLWFYNDTEIYQRLRFIKDDFQYICDLLRADLQRMTQRSYALTPEQQLTLALRFYATGTFQICVGDTLFACKATVCKAVSDVTTLLCQKLNEFVYFPDDPEEIQQIKEGFYDLAGFPGAVGAIDGTHVRIQSPGGDDAVSFFNRKGYSSINVQAIVDSEGRLLNVVADWPGSAHDSRILTTSQIGRDFAEGRKRGILLGDSGYACTSWLLTPFLAPKTDAERRYNSSQIRARNIVERTFGVWKRRFHCLHGEMRMKPAKVCQVIAACAVLHNIGIKRRKEQGVDQNDNDEKENDNDAGCHVNTRYEGLQSGQIFRENFVQQHFARKDRTGESRNKTKKKKN